MKKNITVFGSLLLLAAGVYALTQIETTDTASYDDAPVYEIEIQDHKFVPERIKAKAGEKFKILVHNRDATPEEFESDDFRREKIIPGNSSATIFVAPLETGDYNFFGEFNLDTAKGYLTVE